MSIDRRSFLQRTLASGAFGCLFSGELLGQSASSLVPTGDGRLVVLRLDGGMDALNMFVPYGLQAYYDRRPRIAMRPPNTSGPRVALDLEPALNLGISPFCAELRREYQLGNLAIINKVGLPVINMSHFDARDTIASGRATAAQQSQEPRGWIGRLRDTYLGGDLGVVSLGSGSPREFDAFGAPPARLNVLSDLTFGEDHAARADSAWRMGFMRGLIGSTGQPSAVELSAREAKGRALDLADRVRDALAAYQEGTVYPTGELSNRLKDTARLLNSNLGARVIYMTTGGFDTHNNQYGRESIPFQRISQALGAFCDDLRRIGMFDRTTILVMTEFGRRNQESDSLGTDHGYGGSWFLLGGGVQRGVYGGLYTDADVRAQNLPVAIDYRLLLMDVISGALGFDPRPIFPGLASGANLGLFA